MDVPKAVMWNTTKMLRSFLNIVEAFLLEIPNQGKPVMSLTK